MDTLPCCKGEFRKKIFSILHKMIIILICVVMMSYISIGLINIANEDINQVSMIEEKKEDRNFKPTSRGAVKRMPVSQTYTVYVLTIDDYDMYFEKLEDLNFYRDKIIEATEGNITTEYKEITQSYIDNLTDKEEIENFINSKIKNYNKKKTFYPTVSHRISSLYGARKSPTAGASSFHKGVDISGDYGDNVYAYKYGTVISSGYNSGGYGNMILIKHEDGSSTRYAHLSSVLVQLGEVVSGGQIIGKVGSTGISTGNHLHFEMLINGSNVNPYDYIF